MKQGDKVLVRAGMKWRLGLGANQERQIFSTAKEGVIIHSYGESDPYKVVALLGAHDDRVGWVCWLNKPSDLVDVERLNKLRQSTVDKYDEFIRTRNTFLSEGGQESDLPEFYTKRSE